MRVEVAAAYLGISESTFLREVEDGKLPAPKFITEGRKIWLKDHLDRHLDRLFGALRLPDLDDETDQARKELEEWQA